MIRCVQMALKFRGLRSCSVTSADMNAEKRREEFSTFLTSPNQTLLIATDGFARGINVPNVGFVFHFDIPAQTTTFYFRSTRASGLGN